MKIQQFDIEAVRVPMTVPHRTASGVIEVCPLVLLTVKTDDGVEGYGIVFTYTDAVLKTVASLAETITSLLVGASLDPSSNADMLLARFKLLGSQGMTGMVISGIDMALWDAKARAENKALHALLGGVPKPVKPYGNVGFDGVKGSADGVEALARAGFLGVKAKIGYESVEKDLEVIRAMRSAIGPDLALMVDYNQSLTLEEARHRLLHLKDEGLEWVEEPVYSHAFQDHVTLQEEQNVPLQTGENWWGPSDFEAALAIGVKQRAMPDSQKCGGVTGWVRIAAVAAKHNVKLSSHLWPEVNAQVLSITPTADWLEYADWFNPILKEPLTIENGYTVLENTIGTGVAFNRQAVEQFKA